jgi:hypothetical protein
MRQASSRSECLTDNGCQILGSMVTIPLSIHLLIILSNLCRNLGSVTVLNVTHYFVLRLKAPVILFKIRREQVRIFKARR